MNEKDFKFRTGDYIRNRAVPKLVCKVLLASTYQGIDYYAIENVPTGHKYLQEKEAIEELHDLDNTYKALYGN